MDSPAGPISGRLRDAQHSIGRVNGSFAAHPTGLPPRRLGLVGEVKLLEDRFDHSRLAEQGFVGTQGELYAAMSVSGARRSSGK
jgi:hypothetical protein